jgi:hypothetical protein
MLLSDKQHNHTYHLRLSIISDKFSNNLPLPWQFRRITSIFTLLFLPAIIKSTTENLFRKRGASYANE